MTKTEYILSSFDFSGIELRVIIHNALPWFIAADACDALGMDRTGGTGRWLRGLGQDEKREANRNELPQLFCGSRAPAYTAISESGLYKLVLRSNKPEARKFQEWVTREVLPAIRKTGGYLLNEEARDTAKADDRQAMPLPEAFAQVLQELAASRQLQAETNALLAQLLAERQVTKPAPVPVRNETLISAADAKDIYGICHNSPGIGQDASAYCHLHNIKMGKRHSATYGKINLYPVWVIEHLFGHLMKRPPVAA